MEYVHLICVRVTIFFFPVATLIWFIASLVRFLLLNKKRTRSPQDVPAELWKERIFSLIESGIAAAIINGALIALYVWLSTATFSM